MKTITSVLPSEYAPAGAGAVAGAVFAAVGSPGKAALAGAGFALLGAALARIVDIVRERRMATAKAAEDRKRAWTRRAVLPT